MRSPTKSLLSIPLALIVIGIASHEALAQYERHFLIKRPGLYVGAQSGIGPEALGPGAARLCAMRTIPAGPQKSGGPEINAITNVTVTRVGSSCGPGTVSTVGDSLYVQWGSDCILPGDFIIVSIEASAPFNEGGAQWKNSFGITEAVAVITPLSGPALDPRGVVLLSGGLAALGAWALRRRRINADRV